MHAGSDTAPTVLQAIVVRIGMRHTIDAVLFPRSQKRIDASHVDRLDLGTGHVGLSQLLLLARHFHGACRLIQVECCELRFFRRAALVRCLVADAFRPS